MCSRALATASQIANRKPPSAFTAKATGIDWRERRMTGNFALLVHAMPCTVSTRKTNVGCTAIVPAALGPCAINTITAEHAASTTFAMGAMLGRLATQLKMPRPGAYSAPDEYDLGPTVVNERGRPAAVVLGESLTALATVRALAGGQVQVFSASSGQSESTRYSRLCRTLKRPMEHGNSVDSVEWLTEFCGSLAQPPVVIPTSDADALWLARNEVALRPWCRYSNASFADMLRIVSKDGLYAAALQADVPVVPSLSEPSMAELEAWSLANAAPYLLKPFYNHIATCKLRRKNLLIDDRAALLRYVDREGPRSLIVQRKLDGGDGFILDCYGLCNAGGIPVAMASHRRLRQSPPNFGSTCFGEIPMGGSGTLEAKLFEYTNRLVRHLGYHGIFGVEWLHEPITGELFLIDFNARPFSSIGHLVDSGLNLPMLAYRELIGENLDELRPTPSLEHLFWMDVCSDLQTLRARNNLGWFEWMRSLLKCGSFAVWDSNDPGPWLHLTGKALGVYLGNRIGRRPPRNQSRPSFEETP